MFVENRRETPNTLQALQEPLQRISEDAAATSDATEEAAEHFLQLLRQFKSCSVSQEFVGIFCRTVLGGSGNLVSR